MSFKCGFCRKTVVKVPRRLITTEYHEVAQYDEYGTQRYTEEGEPVITTEIKVERPACPECAAKVDAAVKAAEAEEAKQRLLDKLSTRE